jgi:hypothetical protein
VVGASVRHTWALRHAFSCSPRRALVLMDKTRNLTDDIRYGA